MPFVDNENAYVTGKVPWHHRRRLNGPKEDYSKLTMFFTSCGVAASIVIAGIVMLYLWQPGRDFRTMAMAGVALLAYFSMWIWLFAVNPRTLNRQTWNNYREAGRLFVPTDVAFRLVMAPAVIDWCRSSSVVAQQVDQFLERYVEQLIIGDEVGPIMRSDALLLRELRYKLETDVAEALPKDPRLVMPAHVGEVIAGLRDKYFSKLTDDIKVLEKRLQGVEEERRYQSHRMAQEV